MTTNDCMKCGAAPRYHGLLRVYHVCWNCLTAKLRDAETRRRSE